MANPPPRTDEQRAKERKAYALKISKNPDYQKNRTKNWRSQQHPDRNRTVRYNMTPDQYQKMLKKQRNKCLICKRKFGVYPNNDQPTIDHDHTCCPGIKSCGVCVRGILCRRCNTGLGYLEGNLEEALMYLNGETTWTKTQTGSSTS